MWDDSSFAKYTITGSSMPSCPSLALSLAVKDKCDFEIDDKAHEEFGPVNILSTVL